MRDPRLLEIDFLMDLERRGQLDIRTTGSPEMSYARQGQHSTLYGVDAGRFRDLVVHMLVHDLIGRDVGGVEAREAGANVFRHAREDLLVVLLTGQPISVSITHAGRVRLWSLRDELLRDPDLEPMGLRSKAAWDRELFLRLRFATDEEPLAIVFLDLDNFGTVNKTRGQAFGDDVLRATFEIVKNLVGSRGQVYRCGGEEVAVLAPAMSPARATELAEELRAAIQSGVLERVPALGCAQTASLGVATFGPGVEPRTALDHVDALMREAKQAGKNRVVAGKQPSPA